MSEARLESAGSLYIGALRLIHGARRARAAFLSIHSSEFQVYVIFGGANAIMLVVLVLALMVVVVCECVRLLVFVNMVVVCEC